jgi:Fe-S cluster assembly protein SufD
MTALALRGAQAADLFQEDFAANAGRLPGAGIAWLDARRRAAMDAFALTGVPNRRDEAWKYTDLASALQSDLVPAMPPQVGAGNESAFAEDGPRVSLVNGYLAARQTVLPAGIELVDLGALGPRPTDWVKEHLGISAAGADQPMGAASLALLRGGVALLVKKPMAEPLRLTFSHSSDERASASHSRVLIVLEEGASLKLLESHVDAGDDRSLANYGVEFVLKAGARLDHIRLQAHSSCAMHVTSLGVRVARDAEYRALYAALGTRLSRLDVNVRLGATGAHATLHNVAVLSTGIADTTTVMDHASPHTHSRQLFKSVVGGRGRAVNQGRVTVREGAVKSDSHQLFKSILLGPRAEADAKPELEIFADDVLCGHGTAIGALDEDALFYLRSRGIPEAEARGLLIRAFLAEAVEGFGDDAVHVALWRELDAGLVRLEGGEP